VGIAATPGGPEEQLAVRAKKGNPAVLGASRLKGTMSNRKCGKRRSALGPGARPIARREAGGGIFSRGGGKARGGKNCRGRTSLNQEGQEGSNGGRQGGEGKPFEVPFSTNPMMGARSQGEKKFTRETPPVRARTRGATDFKSSSPISPSEYCQKKAEGQVGGRKKTSDTVFWYGQPKSGTTTKGGFVHATNEKQTLHQTERNTWRASERRPPRS